jgi:hypothetical protein
MSTFCKACGAEILWLEHFRTGKRAPIDAVPMRGGNVVASPEDGKYRLATVGDDPAELHFNHFATCPDAQKFREGGA